MKPRGARTIGLLFLAAGMLSAASAGLISKVKDLAWEKDVEAAREIIESNRPSQNSLTSEWLAAVSWLARGASFAEEWKLAEKYATEAFEASLTLLGRRPLDADRHLPTALGASIEVLGRVYDARGDRAEALRFLREQHAEYKGTSIETRIQKNILLLGLEGKPLPPLEATQYLNGNTLSAKELHGKVVLFYFWAHWCGDCKRQKPILERLYEEYHDRGLMIVGPTRLYGYVSRGRSATPEQELAYLRNPYQEQYPVPSWMSVPVGSQNFLNFGVSTTPTLVLVDREGIVQMYHPGALGYEELAGRIQALLGEERDSL